MGTVMVDIAMFSWIPVVLLIFMLLPPQRAVIVSFMAAWMFLPMTGYDIPGLPDYTKVSAATYAVLLATLIFDTPRIFRFRPSLLDLPMLVWCVVPFFSSVSAGYGPYDGFSSVLNKLIAWGIPYFIGRIYLTDLRALRDLAVAVFIGGLVYLPLCLFEIRMSPQLHNMLYGFHQHDFQQTRRFGGYRPTVFMQHGLAVGTFMCTATLVGFWLWRSKAVRMIYGVPIPWLVLALMGTAVLCRSTGATLLMLVGMGTLVATKMFRTSAVAAGLVVVPVVYLLARTVGGWDGQELLDAARMISGERAESLAARLASEAALWRAVQPNLLLGAARFIYMSMELEEGMAPIVPDGMWLIALGTNGVVGLVAFVGALTVPVAVFLRRAPGRYWASPAMAPAAALAVALALYMCDSLFNAMLNPLFIIAAGGLTSVIVASRRPRKVATPPRRVTVTMRPVEVRT